MNCFGQLIEKRWPTITTMNEDEIFTLLKWHFFSQVKDEDDNGDVPWKKSLSMSRREDEEKKIRR